MSLSEINCIWEFTLRKFNLKNNVSFSTSTLHKQKKILICLISVTKSPLIQTKEIVEKGGKGKSIARCNSTQKVKGFRVGAVFTQRALSLEVQPRHRGGQNVMVHICHPSTQEVGGSELRGHLWRQGKVKASLGPTRL